MMYVKVKFLKNGEPYGRSYTYKSHDELTPGDIVEIPGKGRGVVIDEEVDMEWVETYNEKNIREVRKSQEEENAKSEK